MLNDQYAFPLGRERHRLIISVLTHLLSKMSFSHMLMRINYKGFSHFQRIAFVSLFYLNLNISSAVRTVLQYLYDKNLNDYAVLSQR